ncbi:MAG: DUF2497 domain-containing protein [Hyphomicrobiales bacterium]|nr:DUF2497 domain-containing protein [Hyphomicrobiales bacterium]OQW83288.1 MAG: hypothetical protein BVN31_06350 [Proteobacteria bacterium ST_bin15]
MSKATAAAEPSMEEILASIRRIITDGDAAPAAPAAKSEPPKPEAPKAAAPKPAVPKPAPAPKASEPASQDDIDAMLAAMDAGEDEPAAEPEVAESEAEDEEEALDLAMVRAAADVSDRAAPAKSAPKAMPVVEVEEDLGFEEPVDEEPMAPVMMPAAPVATRSTGAVSAPASMASAPAAAAPALLSQDTEASVAAAFSSLTQAIFSNEPRTIEDVMKELLRPMIKTWLDDNLPSVVERLVREEISRVARGRR